MAGMHVLADRARLRADLQGPGVFNFAQGAMVLFAALAMALLRRVDSRRPGHGASCSPTGVAAMAVMVAVAWRSSWVPVASWSTRRHHLLMATLGITQFFIDGRADALRQRHLQDRRRHAQGPDLPARGRVPGGVLVKGIVRAGDRRGGDGGAWRLFFQKPPSVARARGGRRPPGRASVGIPLNRSGSSSGRRRLWWRWWPACIWGASSACQFSLSLVALKALPVLILAA